LKNIQIKSLFSLPFLNEATGFPPPLPHTLFIFLPVDYLSQESNSLRTSKHSTLEEGKVPELFHRERKIVHFDASLPGNTAGPETILNKRQRSLFLQMKFANTLPRGNIF
jgi:hypothetical protein